MQSKFWQIMFFYAVLSCFIAPGVGYFFMRSNKGLEMGYLLGTAISIMLWFGVGRKMVM
jgi:hypothetical protein